MSKRPAKRVKYDVSVNGVIILSDEENDEENDDMEIKKDEGNFVENKDECALKIIASIMKLDNLRF